MFNLKSSPSVESQLYYLLKCDYARRIGTVEPSGYGKMMLIPRKIARWSGPKTEKAMR